MKTLKEYIELIEGNEPSAGLRAVGVTPSDIEDAVDGFTAPGEEIPQASEQLPPIQVDKSYLEDENGYGQLIVNVSATLGAEAVADAEEVPYNEKLLRWALKTGGVPMPDENSGIANTTGIHIQVTDGKLSAHAFDEDGDKLLKILQDAGLADEEGNAIVPQQEQEQEEVTEASNEAVERVVALSKELNKR